MNDKDSRMALRSDILRSHDGVGDKIIAKSNVIQHITLW